MGKLVLRDVTKMFANHEAKTITTAISDINLTVNEGEFISIVGPSGCGKSTILRLIAGLTTPTRGELTLNGKEIKGTDRQRAMVFQHGNLFPWLTVRQNVRFSLDVNGIKDEGQVERLIEMVGLKGYEDTYPNQLSGGMAQRVALIRTIIIEPEIFLLDEPLGALDAFTRMNMQDELINLWEINRNSMIMVTHDVDESIYMSNKVVVMQPNPGKIKAIVPIDLPYPRVRKSPEFAGYRGQLMELLNY